MSYLFQTFVQSQILTAAEMNQVEENARAHVHGVSSVSLINSGGLASASVNSSNISSGQIGFSHVSPEAILVKAWARTFVNNSSLVSLQASRGIASIVLDLGGEFGFIMTQTLATTSYAVTALLAANVSSGGAGTVLTCLADPSSQNKIRFMVYTLASASKLTQAAREMSVIVVGDIS